MIDGINENMCCWLEGSFGSLFALFPRSRPGCPDFLSATAAVINCTIKFARIFHISARLINGDYKIKFCTVELLCVIEVLNCGIKSIISYWKAARFLARAVISQFPEKIWKQSEKKLLNEMKSQMWMREWWWGISSTVETLMNKVFLT